MRINIINVTRHIAWWFMIMSAVAYMIFRSGQSQFLFIYLHCLGIMDAAILLYFFFRIRKNEWTVRYPNVFIAVSMGLLIWYFVQSKMASYQWIVDSCSWQLAMLMGYFDCTEEKSIVTSFKVYSSFLIMVPFAIQLIIMRLQGLDFDGAIIFSVYYILIYIAFILEEKPTILRSICIVVAIAIVMATSKRTGTISMLIAVVVAMLANDYHMKRLTGREFLNNIIKLIVILTVSIYALNAFISYFDIPLFERLLEMATDNSANGRTTIWAAVRSGFEVSSIKNKLMGYGYHATQYVLNLQNRGIMAHNDFFEIMFDYGYIGLVLIIGLVFIIIKTLLKAFHEKHPLFPSYLYLFIIIFPLMMVSYLFVQSTIAVYAGWFIGRAVCKVNEERVKL